MTTTVHMQDLFSPLPKEEEDDEKQPMPLLESESITTTTTTFTLTTSVPAAAAAAEEAEASGGKKTKKTKEKKPRLTKKQKEAAAAVAAAAAGGAVAMLGQPSNTTTAAEPEKKKKKARKSKKNKRESEEAKDEQGEDAKMATADKGDDTVSEAEGKPSKAKKAKKAKKQAVADEEEKKEAGGEEEDEEEEEEKDSGKPVKPKKVKKPKECCVVGCTAKPTHGMPGTSVSFCASHKEPGTVAKTSKNSCRVMLGKKKCKNVPTFGLVAPADYCAEHKQAGDVDLVERACSTCKMLDVVGGPQNQCAKCYPALNKRLVQAKINDVQNYLRKEDRFNNVTVHAVLDATHLAASGIQRLPDSVFSTPTHHVLLFIDTPQIEPLPTIEDMHADMKKLVELAKSSPTPGTTFKPLVFLRFNPDNFVSRDNISRKKFNKNKKMRYEHLSLRLTELTALVPTEEASLLWVFFDEYSEKETRVHGLMAPAAMLGGSARYTATLSSVANSATQSVSAQPQVAPPTTTTTNSFVVLQAPTLSSMAASSSSAHDSFDGAAAVAAAMADDDGEKSSNNEKNPPLLFSSV